MTTPDLRSSTPHKARGAQTAETAAGMHNVSRMATVAFVAVAVIALLFVRWGLETGNWRPWAASSILAGYGILTLLSAWWSWRGRSVGAVLLMLGGLLVFMPAIMLLAANVGPALASCLVLVTLVMATQMASSRLAGRAIVVSVAVGIATLLLDLYWPVERLAAPTELVIALYVIVAAIILALGFLVVRQFNDYSQRTKLIIAFLAVTLVPLALLTYLNQGATQQALTEAANTKLYAAALQTAGSIDNFIEANRSAVETETRLPDLINYLDLPPDQRRGSGKETQALTVLRALSGKDQNISSYALLDLRGLDVLDTYTPDIDLNKFTSDYFQAPMETGKPYVSPIRFSATTGELVLYFSSPVENAGEIIGVLCMRYKAEALQQIVIQKTGLVGEGSFAVLLDEDHIRLADGNQRQMAFKAVMPLAPDRLAALKADGRLPDWSPEELATNLPGFERSLTKASVQPYFATELHAAGEELKQSAVVKTTQQSWLVVFAQPQRVFLAPVAQQTRNALLVVIGMAVAVTVVALGVAQWTTAPITYLTTVAKQVTEGNLAVQARVQSKDETGMLAIAFNSMTTQLRDLISSLEQRVDERTAQLRASAEVGRAASNILDPQELLQQTVNLICDRFGFYYASIFLVNEDDRFAVLRAGVGEPGRQMLANGHKLAINDRSMVGWACAHKQPRIALDVGQDAVHFANPLLPDTRSEIALPLLVGDRVVGVLDVQSDQEAAFDESDISTLQGMADQTAIALENARLFAQAQASLAENERLVSQIQTSLQDATALYEAGQVISLAQDSPAVFQAIIDRVLKPDIDLCILILFDPYEGEQPQQLEISQVWAHADLASARDLQPGSLAGKRFDFAKFPLRDLLHSDRAQVVHDSQVPLDFAQRQMWDRLEMQTMAFLPLQVGARWVGALGLGTRQSVDTFEDTLRPYQTIVNQAAVAIENHRLVASSEARLRELSELYRSVTGKAWGTFLQAQPTTTEYEYSQAGPAGDTDNVWRIPLQIRGQEIGLVELDSDRQTWSEQERALVEAVVTQAALALDSARLFEQTQRLAGRERLINEITGRIRASTSVSGILQTAARELATAMNVPHAVARISLKAEEPRDPRKGTDDQTA